MRRTGPTLLVATSGGHLAELEQLGPRLRPGGPVLWVTHPGPQADALARNHDVLRVPYVPPRGYGEVVRALPGAFGSVRRLRPSRLVSTGAGVALPWFLAARAHRVPCHYVESAARGEGPSMTGRLLAALPGTRLYTQHEEWAGRGRWRYGGSVFAGFAVEEGVAPAVNRVVVSVGTQRDYGFRRLVTRMHEVLEASFPEAEVLWQVGATDVTGLSLRGRVAESVGHEELRAAIAGADVVVCHAGVGSALSALDLGRRPVLVPRRVGHHEHVDDHQGLVARELGERGLAVVAEADAVTADDLLRAASARVTADPDPQPVELLEG